MPIDCDALVIGGGFYGLFVAEHLAKLGRRVVLCERDIAPMRRASYVNQARVHNGYHYPRSILTAVRSRVNFPRFVEEFRDAIDSNFEKIYAVGRRFSKVSAEQFYGSMRRIEAPIRPAEKPIRQLFDPAYIDGVFTVREYAFNTAILCEIMLDRIRHAGVELRLESEVTSVRAEDEGKVRVDIAAAASTTAVTAKQVLCCCYSQLNAPGAARGISPIPLKHELTEMALVEVPERLRGLGITVMDGPFFSLMPFPSRGLYTLSHVRYTPHAHWFDGETPYKPVYERMARIEKTTAYPHMIRDSARYLPAIRDCKYRDSLWEVKTLLPRSEMDDSRPILFRRDYGIPNYHLVMGGKIDNVYDIIDFLT